REGRPRETPEALQALDKAAEVIGILQNLLEGRDYVGGSFGIADIPLAVTLSRWHVLGRDLADWPVVEAWYRRCAARPAFRARVFVGTAAVTRQSARPASSAMARRISRARRMWPRISVSACAASPAATASTTARCSAWDSPARRFAASVVGPSSSRVVEKVA